MKRNFEDMTLYKPLLKTCLVLDTLHNKITIIIAILKIIIVNMYQVLGLPRWH